MEAAGQDRRDGAAAVQVRGMACHRGGRLLFTGVTLDLAPGEAALVTGPNGVGKSSLLRVLAGLLPVFDGEVEVTGAAALADDRLALDMDLPLARALGFWAAIDGGALTPALEAMALGELGDVPVRMLSAGQRRRAALARVIASGAAVWLLDEPTNGLDGDSIELLGRAASRHLASGGIVVAASHQPLPWSATTTLALPRTMRAAA